MGSRFGADWGASRTLIHKARPAWCSASVGSPLQPWRRVVWLTSGCSGFPRPPVHRIIHLNPAAQYGTTGASSRGKAIMSFKSPSFGDRVGASANAKKAALERFRVKSADPAAAERQAARKAAQLARDARDTERRTARQEAEARAAAEQAAQAAARDAERDAREAARVAEHAAREAALAEQVAREIAQEAERRGAILSKASAKAETDTALLAAQKATRDARYAARKARK